MEPYTGDRLACETGDARPARAMMAMAEPTTFHVGWLDLGSSEASATFGTATSLLSSSTFDVSVVFFPRDFGAIVIAMA